MKQAVMLPVPFTMPETEDEREESVEEMLQVLRVLTPNQLELLAEAVERKKTEGWDELGEG